MSNSNRFPQDDSTRPKKFANSFDSVSDSQLAGHLRNSQYGEFKLTDAVRPALDLKITPTQGYRHEVYVDEESNAKVPVVMAAASREALFPLFMQLIQKLGPVVDVVLESSHTRDGGEHVDMYREQIDMPVLLSVLWDYEDLLLNDGCTGIAVLNPNTPQEIQFEEHKLLIIYGSPLEQFEFVLESNGVTENQDMKLITEAEHVHSSTESFAQRFEELRVDLGLDGNQQREKFEKNNEEEAYGDSFDNYNSESYGDSYRDSYGDDSGLGGIC